MSRALGDDERAGRARDRRQELRHHRCTLGGADQGMMGEYLERNRVLAGDHSVHQCPRVACAEIDDVLSAQLPQIRHGLVFAPSQTKIGDEQWRANCR